MAETRLQFKFRPADLPRHTSDEILAFAKQALQRSVPQIAGLWASEAERLCPVRTGRMKGNIRFSTTGGTKIKHNYVFYEIFVRARQGQNDFLLTAFLNIRKSALQVIRNNFYIITTSR